VGNKAGLSAMERKALFLYCKENAKDYGKLDPDVVRNSAGGMEAWIVKVKAQQNGPPAGKTVDKVFRAQVFPLQRAKYDPRANYDDDCGGVFFSSRCIPSGLYD
jgi:hypothetical protein